MRSSLVGVPYQHSIRLPGVTMAPLSCSAKLSPVELVPDAAGGKMRPIPQGPFCASTYVSIRSTCPDSCAFKDNGCYAQGGSSRRIMRKLDAAAQDPAIVMAAEATLMGEAFGGIWGGRVPQDGARGGRDLRLHVGGDVHATLGAGILALAARSWLARGGGAVWTYTHRWREIPRRAWGLISVWASCETVADVRAAWTMGYRAALVHDREPHKSGRAFHLDGGTGDGVAIRVVPCPYETRGVTCVKCRLCLDAPIDRNVVIGFRAHGRGSRDKAIAALNKRRLEVV